MIERATLLAVEGCVLTCPGCSDTIGILRKSLYQNHTFGLDAIAFRGHQAPLNQQAHCRLCGTSYAELDISRHGRTMLIHTSHGWLPRPPPNVEAPPRAPIRSAI